ncbi:MAG: ATP-binding protein [Actinomycetota bacterium]|nr:ATP-binding protein [Actinomycetota bacterium]
MNITYSLLLPRDEISVPVVRRVCGTALRDLGVVEPCVSDVQLAVTEACTNVLKHADGTAEEYEVTVEVNEQLCVIRVLDTGSGFEHEHLGREVVHEGAESGRGIQLMRALVDTVNFISRPEVGTVVHLEKNLECNPDSVLMKLADRAAVTR